MNYVVQGLPQRGSLVCRQRREDGKAARALEAIGRRRRVAIVVGSADRDAADVPVVCVDDAYRAQACLKSPTEMHRLFARLPVALSATAETLAKF